MLSRSQFFNEYKNHFFGTQFFILDKSRHPSIEIEKISKTHEQHQMDEVKFVSSLAALTVFYFRFTINGEVWDPTRENFKNFTNGTFRCMCTQCPKKVYEECFIENFVINFKRRYERNLVIIH